MRYYSMFLLFLSLAGQGNAQNPYAASGPLFPQQPADGQKVQNTGSDSCEYDFFKYLDAQYFLGGLVQLPDHTWLTGGSRQQDSILLAHIDVAGDIIHASYFNILQGEKEMLLDLARTSDGYVIGVGGGFSTSNKLFAFKYDLQSDTLVWVRSYLINVDQISIPHYIVQLREMPGNGNYLLKMPVAKSGNATSLIQFDKTNGDIIEAHYIATSDFEFRPAGQKMFLTGSVTIPLMPVGLHLSALSGSGQLLWSKVYRDTAMYMNGRSITEWNNALYVLGRNATGTPNFQLLKVDTNGTLIWARTIEQDLPLSFHSFGGDKIVTVDDGVLAVFYRSSSAGSPEPYAYFYKFDADGDIVWKKILQLPANFEINEVHVDGDDLWMMGRYLNGGNLPLLARINSKRNFSVQCLYYENAKPDEITVLNPLVEDPADVEMPLSYQSQPVSGQHFPAGVAFQKVCTVAELCPDTACDIKTPAGCFRYELLGIRLDSLGQRRYRVRVTNTCASPLQYACIQLPNGVTAVSPEDGSAYTASGGNGYAVRNPNASPFYSIRFKAQSGALHNGQSDIFEYTLPQQSAPDYIHIYAKLADGSASEAHLNTFNCPAQPWPGAAADRSRQPSNTAPATPRVWPNPSSGYLLIDRHAWSEQAVWLRVMNAQGQVVYERHDTAGMDNLRVDLPEGLDNGMYYLLVTAGECAVLRFVLER